MEVSEYADCVSAGLFDTEHCFQCYCSDKRQCYIRAVHLSHHATRLHDWALCSPNTGMACNVSVTRHSNVLKYLRTLGGYLEVMYPR